MIKVSGKPPFFRGESAINENITCILIYVSVNSPQLDNEITSKRGNSMKRSIKNLISKYKRQSKFGWCLWFRNLKYSEVKYLLNRKDIIVSSNENSGVDIYVSQFSN